MRQKESYHHGQSPTRSAGAPFTQRGLGALPFRICKPTYKSKFEISNKKIKDNSTFKKVNCPDGRLMNLHTPPPYSANSVSYVEATLYYTPHSKPLSIEI